MAYLGNAGDGSRKRRPRHRRLCWIPARTREAPETLAAGKDAGLEAHIWTRGREGGAWGRVARGRSSSEPAGMVGGGGEEIVGWEGEVRMREGGRDWCGGLLFFILFFRWMDG